MKTVVSGSCPSFSRPSYEGPSVDPHGSSSIGPRWLSSGWSDGRSAQDPKAPARIPSNDHKKRWENSANQILRIAAGFGSHFHTNKSF